MGDEAESLCCGSIHEVASEDGEACSLYPADSRGTLSPSETGVDPYRGLWEPEHGLLCAHPVVAGQRQLQTPAQGQSRGKGDRGVRGVLDHVQDPVPVVGELLDLVEGVLADHVDEELHVRTRDECLAGSFEHDCVDVGPRIEVLHHPAQLAYYCDVEGVHRLRPVDEYRCDTGLVHIDVDVAEVEGIRSS